MFSECDNLVCVTDFMDDTVSILPHTHWLSFSQSLRRVKGITVRPDSGSVRLQIKNFPIAIVRSIDGNKLIWFLCVINQIIIYLSVDERSGYLPPLQWTIINHSPVWVEQVAHWPYGLDFPPHILARYSLISSTRKRDPLRVIVTFE